MEENKKSGRGGRREGAGRHKRVESQKVLFYFEKELYDKFPKSINRNAYINGTTTFNKSTNNSSMGNY